MTYCVAIKLRPFAMCTSAMPPRSNWPGLISTCRSFLAVRSRAKACVCFRSIRTGNFIEATPETPYFQVGESKYGKPVLDRVITPNTPLDEAAKCALMSMDSTLKSNLSVGLPLDMVVYEANQFQTDKVVCIDEHNPYFKMMHNSWGVKLCEVFDSIEAPMWNGEQTAVPLMQPASRSLALKKISSPQEKLI